MPAAIHRSDANGDGLVDLADLNMVLANFGQTTDIGDVTGDGAVDLGDLNWYSPNSALTRETVPNKRERRPECSVGVFMTRTESIAQTAPLLHELLISSSTPLLRTAHIDSDRRSPICRLVINGTLKSIAAVESDTRWSVRLPCPPTGC